MNYGRLVLYSAFMIQVRSKIKIDNSGTNCTCIKNREFY